MKVWRYYLLMTLELLTAIIITGTQKLRDDKILRHEPVHYSIADLHHQIESTSSSVQSSIFLNFTAYNRVFKLRLHRDQSPFTSQYSVKLGKKKIPSKDLAFVYSGIDTDYPDSNVYGKIEDGLFEGSIRLSHDEIYHVIPSHKPLSDKEDSHSVIYSQRDYELNEVNTDSYISSLSNIFLGSTSGSYESRFKRQTSFSSLNKRSDSAVQSKVCSMGLTVDHTVWRHVKNITNQNEVRTYSHIIYLLRSHVEELNQIYRDITFPIKTENSNDGTQYLNLQFHIEDIEIIKEDCLKDYGEEFCSTRDPEVLLRFYAEKHDDPYSYYEGYDDSYDQDETDSDYCLRFLFTARDLRRKHGKEAFPVLGATFPVNEDTGNGICRGGNFGFVSFCQYSEDNFISPMVTKLVLAHEIAHAVGAPHDDDKTACLDIEHSSKPDGGFYLMHSIAQSGREINNRFLSNCSMQFMSKILSDASYTECLKSNMEPFCGNRIIEEGEQCDCGMAPCDDPCCHGMDPEHPSNSCKLKTGAQCSSSNGPCCDLRTCSYIQKHENIACKNRESCVDEIYCYGERYGASCPPPLSHQIRPDGFHCSRYGRVCDKGNCNKSICTQINWHECQVTNSKIKLSVEDKEELCFLGCQKTKKSECITSHNETEVLLFPDLAKLFLNISLAVTPYVHFPIGSPCNSYRGYCDSYHRCRGTEPDTPLVILKNCFVGGHCFEFFKSNYLAVAALFVTLAVLSVLLAKCCAFHTRSSNPKLESKHPKQTVRQSLNRLSSMMESVNVENIRHTVSSARNSVRNSFNFENERHSFRSSTVSRQVSRSNPPDAELENLNEKDDKTNSIKQTFENETEVLTKEKC